MRNIFVTRLQKMRRKVQKGRRQVTCTARWRLDSLKRRTEDGWWSKPRPHSRSQGRRTTEPAPTTGAGSEGSNGPPEAPGMCVVAGVLIAVGVVGNRLGHQNFWVRIKHPTHVFSIKLNFRVISPNTKFAVYYILFLTCIHKVRVWSRSSHNKLLGVAVATDQEWVRPGIEKKLTLILP